MKWISLGVGLLVGAVLGTSLVVFFSPVSGKELIESLKEGYAESWEIAQQAGEARKRELEAQYQTMKVRR